MSKIVSYLKETTNELLYKVSWPTWKELQSSSVVVLVASIIIGIVIFLMDQSFSNVLEYVYQKLLK